MNSIDWPTLINWIVSGMIGVVLGAISGWITYSYQLRQSKIAWNREKEYQERQKVQEKLTQGLDNPYEAIKNLKKWNSLLQTNIHSSGKERGTIQDMEPFSYDERRRYIYEALQLASQIDAMLERIGTIIKREDTIHAVETIERNINTSIRQGGTENLAREKKVLLAVLSFRNAVNDGALFSVSDEILQNVEDALAEIGAPYIVPLVKEVKGVISNSLLPGNHQEWGVQLGTVEQQAKVKLREFETKLQEYDSVLMDLMVKYAEQHEIGSQEDLTNNNIPQPGI